MGPIAVSVRLIVPLAVAALLVAGCGSDDGTASSANPGNGTDRAFVAAMIPHHESAVEMSEIAQERATSQFVKTLAENIIRTQNEEIDLMRREDADLADAGIEEGDLGVPEHMMGMSGDMASLETAKPFDPAFVQMMIPHHEGALEMAKVEIEKGSDPELKKLAEEILSAQQKEIAEMKDFLGADSDAGGAGHGSGHSG